MAQEKHQRHRDGEGDEESAGPETAGQQRREKLDGEADAVLDDIDDALEENAEEFVRSYVQKGGE